MEPSIIEKAISLTDMGNGLLNRIYLIKSKLKTPSKRDLYLGGEEFKKLRYIFVKKFPKIPSIGKLEADEQEGGIPGGQRFLSNAVNTCRILSSYRDLVYDIVDFSVTTSRLLIDIPTIHVLEFSLEKNREICILFMDLLCIYMRVAIFFSSLHDEGFAMYAMYAAACQYLKIVHSREEGEEAPQHAVFGNLGNLDEKYTENIVIMFDEHLRDTQRHFIDLFAPIAPRLKGLLLQMRRSIYMVHDLDALNNEGVLSLLNDEAKSNADSEKRRSSAIMESTVNIMYTGSHAVDTGPVDIRRRKSDAQKKAKPKGKKEENGKKGSKDQPSTSSVQEGGEGIEKEGISLFVELADAVGSYRDYAIYAALACPVLLFDSDVLDLLKVCTEHVLVVHVFRDFCMSIHVVLEAMSLSYPDPALDPLVVIPKGVKLKTTLKHIARIAVTSSDSYHRARRIYLTNVLERFVAFLRQCPGLVAPKFPQLLCLAAFAKEEVLCYYRHLSGSVRVRRDCKKYYTYDNFISMDIGPAVASLQRLTDVMRASRCLVINYYSEYLCNAHVAALEPLFAACTTFSSRVGAVGQRLLDDLIAGTSKAAARLTTKDDKRALSKGFTGEDEQVGEEEDKRSATIEGSLPVGGVYEIEGGMTKMAIGGTDAPAMESDSEELADGDTISVDLFRMHWGDLQYERHRLAAAATGLSAHAHIASVDNGHGSGSQVLAGTIDVPLNTGDVRKLETFRLNWLVLLTYLSSSSGLYDAHSSTDQDTNNDVRSNLRMLAELCQIMTLACRRSQYVSDLPALYEKYCEPAEIWWYREQVEESFTDMLESPNLHESASVMTFACAIPLALRSLHRECPSEMEPLVKSMVAATEAMLEDVALHVVEQFDSLWRMMEDLELQAHPLEAAHRAQRNVLQRQALLVGVIDSVENEPPAGFESRASERESLDDFLRCRNNMLFVLASVQEFCRSDVCRTYGLDGATRSASSSSAIGEDSSTRVTCGGFVCYNREYHTGGYIQQKLCNYLESRVHEIFFSGDRREKIKSVNKSWQYLISGVKLLDSLVKVTGPAPTIPLQTSLGQSSGWEHQAQLQGDGKHFDFSGWMRVLLFREGCDTTFVPPPGQLLSSVLTTNSKNKGQNISNFSVGNDSSIVWKYANWYVYWCTFEGCRCTP